MVRLRLFSSSCALALAVAGLVAATPATAGRTDGSQTIAVHVVDYFEWSAGGVSVFAAPGNATVDLKSPSSCTTVAAGDYESCTMTGSGTVEIAVSPAPGYSVVSAQAQYIDATGQEIDKTFSCAASAATLCSIPYSNFGEQYPRFTVNVFTGKTSMVTTCNRLQHPPSLKLVGKAVIGKTMSLKGSGFIPGRQTLGIYLGRGTPGLNGSSLAKVSVASNGTFTARIRLTAAGSFRPGSWYFSAWQKPPSFCPSSAASGPTLWYGAAVAVKVSGR